MIENIKNPYKLKAVLLDPEINSSYDIAINIRGYGDNPAGYLWYEFVNDYDDIIFCPVPLQVILDWEITIPKELRKDLPKDDER